MSHIQNHFHLLIVLKRYIVSTVHICFYSADSCGVLFQEFSKVFDALVAIALLATRYNISESVLPEFFLVDRYCVLDQQFCFSTTMRDGV